jgi:WD40 repeat protein
MFFYSVRKKPVDNKRSSSIVAISTSSLKKILVLRGHLFGLESVTISKDNKRLAVGGSGGQVCVWDLAKRKKCYESQIHGNPVLCVRFGGADKLYSASGGFSIVEHDLARLDRVTRRGLDTDFVQTPFFVSASGNEIFVANKDGVDRFDTGFAHRKPFFSVDPDRARVHAFFRNGERYLVFLQQLEFFYLAVGSSEAATKK